MYKAIFKCECGHTFGEDGETLTGIVDKIIEEGCPKCKDPKNILNLENHYKIEEENKLMHLNDFTKRMKF